MPISYEMFMKHAEKVCKNKASVARPILSGVKHQENGDLFCTDSHRLYVAKGIHTRTVGAVLTPKGAKVDGNYPDVSRLIPDPLNAKQTINLEVKELLQVADMISSIGGIAEAEASTNKSPSMDFIGDAIGYTNFAVKINYSFYPLRFEEALSANAVYVLDAMKLLKAAGCQTVTLNFFGRMRPFTLVNEDESLLALILPIRK
ncbi:MAG: polymerase subunit beta [Paenibacillus sp.]|nr:polymerase subunit beta [Paenibacillus sp.]